jgi:hypothetical protein
VTRFGCSRSFDSAAPNASASVLSLSVQTSYGNFSFSAHERFFSGVLNPAPMIVTPRSWNSL